MAPDRRPQNSSTLTFKRGLRIYVREMDGGGWESSVGVNGRFRGGGTAPTVAGALDVAMEILYGDTNDHLNGDFGAIKELESDA